MTRSYSETNRPYLTQARTANSFDHCNDLFSTISKSPRDGESTKLMLQKSAPNNLETARKKERKKERK